MSLRTKLYLIKGFIALACCLSATLMSHLVPSFAATGDILYQNCAGEGCVGADPSVTYLTRSVETSGCQSGNCLKVVGSYNSGGGLYGGSSQLSIPASGISGKNEITVVYYTKFSKANISAGNLKSIRPYVGGPNYYFGATVTQHWTNDLYFSTNNGTTRPESEFTCRDNGYDDTYMVANGDGTYDTAKGRISGSFDFSSTGGQDGFGAYWTKVRHWIKLPFTITATDGEMKVWINGELAFHSYDLSHYSVYGDPPQSTFSGFTFYPSSEAGEPFEQWMDEMIVYEGYVPPEGDLSGKSTILMFMPIKKKRQ